MTQRFAVKMFVSLLALAAASGAQARGDFGLAPVFTDHAVLQRDKPVAVWGQAPANEVVDLTLSDAR